MRADVEGKQNGDRTGGGVGQAGSNASFAATLMIGYNNCVLSCDWLIAAILVMNHFS